MNKIFQLKFWDRLKIDIQCYSDQIKPKSLQREGLKFTRLFVKTKMAPSLKLVAYSFENYNIEIH